MHAKLTQGAGTQKWELTAQDPAWNLNSSCIAFLHAVNVTAPFHGQQLLKFLQQNPEASWEAVKEKISNLKEQAASRGQRIGRHRRQPLPTPPRSFQISELSGSSPMREIEYQTLADTSTRVHIIFDAISFKIRVQSYDLKGLEKRARKILEPKVFEKLFPARKDPVALLSTRTKTK